MIFARKKRFVAKLSAKLSTGLLVGLMLSVGVAEAVECKGKSKSGCSSNSACVWVDSYKTKTGSKVKAYCRKKGGSPKKTRIKKSGTKKSGSKKPAKPKTSK